MTKQILTASGNTAWGFGSIFIILREEVSFFLSLIIALLTIIYLIYQIKKCIADTDFKNLEIKQLKKRKETDEGK